MAAGDKKPRPIGEDLISRECPAATAAALTGTLTGTLDNIMADVDDTAAACEGGATPTAAQVDAAIARAVASIVTGVNKNLKELQDEVNKLRTDNAALKTQLLAAGIVHNPAT